MADVIRPLRHREHGGNRVALVSALARLASAKSRAVLNELAADPELALEMRHAQKAGKTRGSKQQLGPSTAKARASELAEASMKFDAPLVTAFLGRLSALLTGFGAEESARRGSRS